MKQTKHSKIVELANVRIPGLEERLRQFSDWLKVNGRTESTVINYKRSIATLALHQHTLPENISEVDLNEYLSLELSKLKVRSGSGFKHLVYSMRAYSKMLGNEMRTKMPVLRKEHKLPVSGCISIKL